VHHGEKCLLLPVIKLHYSSPSKKKLPALYVTRKFITANKTACHLSFQSQINPDHAFPFYFSKTNFNIIFPSTPKPSAYLMCIILNVFSVNVQSYSKFSHNRPWIKCNMNPLEKVLQFSVQPLHCSASPLLLHTVSRTRGGGGIYHIQERDFLFPLDRNQ